MTPERRRLNQALQLKRLRLLREERAQRARRAAASALAAAQQQVREREAEVAARRVDRSSLLQRAVTDAATLPRLAPYLAARREDLDDQLERAEYALIDDEEACEEAAARLDDATRDWRREHVRGNAVQDLHRRARADELRAAERRSEREDAARAPGINPLTTTGVLR